MVERWRLLLKMEEAPTGHRLAAYLVEGDVDIFQRQRKKKKRCTPVIQEGRGFLGVAGGGIPGYLLFYWSGEPESMDGDAGRREDGACFRF
ncbi:MAG: hypothetical protein ACXWM6_15205 [Thermodesulfobacteriota bacterium]